MKRKIAFALSLALLLLVSLAASPRPANASWYLTPGSNYLYPAENPTTPVTNPTPSTPTTPPAPTGSGGWYWNRAYYIQQWYGQPQAPAQPATPTPEVPYQPPVPVTPAPAPAPVPGAVQGSPTDEALMVSLVNQARINAGLNPLQVDATLTQLARMKSQDILVNNYFAHTSPTYGSAFTMMKNAGVTYRVAGENLAKARDTAWAHQRLMASDGHRTNILYPDFTHIGVGIVKYEYGVVVTELFIGK
jgi:uncharacterized YkwD family protein